MNSYHWTADFGEGTVIIGAADSRGGTVIIGPAADSSVVRVIIGAAKYY